eukprot:619149-Rhodomonas_salina.2
MTWANGEHDARGGRRQHGGRVGRCSVGVEGSRFTGLLCRDLWLTRGGIGAGAGRCAENDSGAREKVLPDHGPARKQTDRRPGRACSEPFDRPFCRPHRLWSYPKPFCSTKDPSPIPNPSVDPKDRHKAFF